MKRDNDSYKALANIQVVTMALNLPGPLAAKRLVELGADVIKVEPPSGDPFEQYLKLWYDDLNSGQKIKTIDLKTAKGLEDLQKLLADTALLITAQRPKALERLGLGWESSHKAFPKLNHLEIVGYPAPNHNLAGHDISFQAEHGLINPPNMPATLVADMAGGLQATTKSLEMIMAFKDGQAGKKHRLSLAEAAQYMAQPIDYGVTAKGGLLSGILPEYSIYQTKDGWVALAALEPHFKKRLKESLGLNELKKNSLREIFKQRGAKDWAIWANENDIPLTEIIEL